MSERAVHLRITGRVQGVGYRDWTMRKALDLGVNGWVRNRTDGSVEVVAAGDHATIAQFIEACHDGPHLAAVTAVEVSEWSEPVAPGFDFRETA